MATWRKYFNSSGNAGLPVNVTGAPTDGYATTHSRYSSWLPEVYAGSPNRLMRYIQYDQMDNDLEVNPLKSKQLTNFRASGKDDAIVLSPPVKLTLERAISYIQDDELVEITPNHIRLRKKLLTENERKRANRAREKDA